MLVTPGFLRKCSTLTVLFLAASTPLGAQEKEDDSPIVKKFLERAATEKGEDAEKLRQEILGFMRRNAGTRLAMQAAQVLEKLPSPLDSLDARSIPVLDRFDHQPKELVAVLGEHRGRQGHVASAVAHSKKGKVIASAGHNGYVRLWDPTTLRERGRVSTGTPAICVAISPDEKFVAAGNTHGGLYVWNISGKQPAPAGAFSIATSPVYSVDFTPDGKTLAAGAFDGLVHLYDTSGDKATTRTQLSGHTTAVRAVRFSPNGKTLAAGAVDGSIRFWNLAKETVSELGKVEGHPKGVLALSFSPTGSILAAGTGEGILAFWNIGARITPRGKSVKVHAGAFECIAYAPNGQSLFTSASDGARVWNLATMRPRYVVEGHVGIVHGGDFSPDSRTLVTAGHDWTVRLWNLGAKATEKFPLKGHWSQASAARLAPDGKSLATGSEDHSLRVWDLTKASAPQVAQFPCDAQVYSLAYGSDGKTIASAGHSTTVTLWDAATRRKVRSFPGAPTIIYQIALTTDGTRLLASSGKELILWNASTGNEITRFDMHKERINSFSVTGDGRYALTGTGYYEYKDGKIVMKDNEYQYVDCSMRLLDLQSFELVKEQTKLKFPVYSVAFTPDGRQAVASQWRSNSRLWDISPEQFKDKGDLMTGVTYAHQHHFSPDGRRLVTLGQEHRIVVYDMIAGKSIWQWVPYEYVSSIAVTPDSRYLVVGLQTGPVYVLRLRASPVQASR